MYHNYIEALPFPQYNGLCVKSFFIYYPNYQARAL